MTAVYTVREVADLLRLSPQTVYRAIDAGQLPAVRLMGVVRVPAAALDALTQSHALASATAAASSLAPADVVEGAAAIGAAGAPVASRGAASSGKSASRSSTAPTTEQRPDVSASGLHDNAAVMTRQKEG